MKAQTVDSTRVPKTWKGYFPGIRLAFGAQKSFYTEAGISLQRYIYDARHGFVAYTFYAAMERRFARGNEKAVNAFKIGAESVFNGGTGGIEIKWQHNDLNEDFVITPKYGFGIGAATIFYGYNISTSSYPFRNIGRNQLSLAINTNILFYHLKNRD